MKSSEFPAQWSIFHLFPKGKCRTFSYNSGVSMKSALGTLFWSHGCILLMELVSQWLCLF